MTAPSAVCENAGGVIAPGNPCNLSPKAAKTELGDWDYLLNFRPWLFKQDIKARFPTAQDPYYHAIEDAKGDDVNFDFYPVQILKWPSFDGDVMTPEHLISHV